ncbi:MAG: NAD(P)H-hydrate epimerase, partial [Candidatus Omnitrophica bacterium]|nr:NAD(P)H-hydrate epimerase [Candidatus Omnitrophota bacterium]
LLNHDIKVKIYIIGKAEKLKQDAAINYSILKKCGYAINEIISVTPGFTRDIKRCDCVVDAIFGVGLSREIKDPFKAVIDKVNDVAKAIIAVDVPSGLNATTGDVSGPCIKARQTVTFTFAKQGFLKKEGPAYTGKIIVVDIGIPKRLLNK